MKQETTPEKLLIVDDTPENLQLLATILQNEGYKVSFARSGDEALRIVESVAPDLILLDILMPQMTGFEVCEHLKSNSATAGIPVIFLTARATEEDILRGFDLGGVDYVTKPFRHAELCMRVKTHIALKKANETIKRQKDDLESSNLALISDASRISKLNERLMESESRLRELNHMKDKFFSIIAHDLKSPFSGFIGYTELLALQFEHLDPEEIKTVAKAMHENAQNIYALLENLLSWARSQTGSLENSPWPHNIHSTIENVIRLLNENAVQKKIELLNHADAELDGFFDQRLFHTVLRNLISNALKYSYSGSKIIISAGKLDDDMCVISVADEGVGLTAAQIENIFRMDYKHSTPGTEKETGTGLGLMLSREFVNMMGGSIKVESEVGKGTVFSFTVHARQENY